MTAPANITTRPCRVRSRDGDGMRGIFSDSILAALERLTGKLVAELIDTGFGTSTRYASHKAKADELADGGYDEGTWSLLDAFLRRVCRRSRFWTETHGFGVLGL